MGIFSFLKSAGEALGFGGKDEAPSADDLKKEVERLGLKASGLDVSVHGDTVKVSGTAQSQADKEKLILALGNVAGVAKVEEAVTASTAGAEATFYTVQKGDSLSAIAKAHYGDAGAYNQIFEANKPMLQHPDKIYPGQVLRIPAKA
jgi:nucleoid-associated protein YgaU